MFKRKSQTNSGPRQPRVAPGKKAPVYSYYSSRSGTPSSGSAASEAPTRRQSPGSDKRGLNWRLLPTFIALLAIIVSVAYASGLDTNPRINKGKNKASPLLQADEVYQQEAQRLLSKSLFSRSKLLIDTKTVEDQLMDRFAELRTASITIPLTGRRLIVAVSPVQPVLKLVVGSKGYIIDDTGRAVTDNGNSDTYKQLKLPVAEDKTGVRAEVGKVVLPTADALFIKELAHQLDAKKLKIKSMTLPAIANQLDVRLEGTKYYVKFNLAGDARIQAGALVSVKNKLASQGINPATYLDVRVEDKVFYK